MILLTLLYPDGQRRETILAGTPRKGDTVRLRGGKQSVGKPLVVEAVEWMEADNGIEPIILVSVRPAAP